VQSYNGQTWMTYQLNAGPANDIWDMTVDPTGRLWLATSAGVWWYNGQAWGGYDEDSIDPSIASTIWAIASDKESHIWGGSSDHGVSEFDGQTWHTYTTADGLADNTVWAIATDQAGHKWFGTDGGVSEFDGQTWRTYTTADGLAANNVRAIAIDQEGNKWFGTFGHGVTKFDGQTWTTYTTADGLVNNQIEAIAVDEQGRLWFATRGGVSQFDSNP
jgi:ligand-binding sensor domain-containing protein